MLRLCLHAGRKILKSPPSSAAILTGIVVLTGRFATKSFRYTAVQSIRHVLKLTYSLIFELNFLQMQTL